MKLDCKTGLAILSAGVLIGIGLDRSVLRQQQQATGESLAVVAPSEPNPSTIESPIIAGAQNVSPQKAVIPQRPSSQFAVEADWLWRANGSNADELHSLLMRWAQADPAAAATWALNLPKGPQRTGAMKAAMSTWAKIDPVAAAAFAEEMQTGADHKMAISIISNVWAASDPESALAWANQLTDATTKNDALFHTTASVLDSDSKRAAQIAELLTESEMKNDLLHNIVALGRRRLEVGN